MDKVAVIIVTYNSAGYIGECLGSLARQTHTAHEVIVVDNASSDDTVHAASGYGAHIIKNHGNLGFAAANNIGASYAINQLGSEYIILLNPDTVAHERMIEELLETMKSHPGCGIAQGKVFLMQDKALLNTSGNILNYLYFSYCDGYKKPDFITADKVIPVASGACLMVRAEVLDKIGWLFNEDFFIYHEDTDLSVRAMMAGYSVMLSSKAVVWHDYRFSSSKVKFFHMEKNRLFLLLQDHEPLTLLLLLPAVLFTEAQVLFFSIINGWLGYKIKSYFWLLANFGRLLKRRRQVQAMRRVRDAGLFGQYAYEINFEEVNNPGLKYITNPALRLHYKAVSRLIGAGTGD